MRLAYFTIHRTESQGLFSILSRFFAGFAPFLPGKASAMDRSGEQGRGKKNFQRFWKKGLTNGKESCIMQPALGRLAQLVEHALDVRRVSGSSPLSSTIEASRFLSRCFFISFREGNLMEQKLSLEALTLADIQPSQFYIFGEKLRRVLTCAILNPARCMNSRAKPCS